MFTTNWLVARMLAKVSRFLAEARQIKSRGRSTGMMQDQGATLRTPSGLMVEMKVTGRGNSPSLMNGFKII